MAKRDLLAIRARDVYAYGLALMDVLFSKEEMVDSLIEESKKSKKRVLDKERMDKLWSKILKYCVTTRSCDVF